MAGVITLVVVSWGFYTSILIAALSVWDSIWFLGQTLFSALEPSKGGITYMQDPWKLALSLCGGLILLGVAFGSWLDQKVPHAKAHKADDIYQERRVIRNR